MTGNLNIPAAECLTELFESHYCAECGGDAEPQTAVPYLGNWFACCDHPRDETQEDCPLHPVIATFHAARGNSIG